jgi:hypothetical protein
MRHAHVLRITRNAGVYHAKTTMLKSTDDDDDATDDDGTMMDDGRQRLSSVIDTPPHRIGLTWDK